MLSCHSGEVVASQTSTPSTDHIQDTSDHIHEKRTVHILAVVVRILSYR